MPEIFISYRHDDARIAAGRLTDELTRWLGEDHLFRDPQIEPGARFPDVLQAALADSRVLLVVMGPQWEHLRMADGQPRLSDPEDWVRREIATALRLGKRVIPVLLERQSLPAPEILPEEIRALRECQAYHVTDRHWQQDVRALATAIAKILDLPILNEGYRPTAIERVRQTVVGLAGWVLVALTLLLGFRANDRDAVFIFGAAAGVLGLLLLAAALLARRTDARSLPRLVLGPGSWVGHKTTSTLAALAVVAGAILLLTRAARPDSVDMACLCADRVVLTSALGSLTTTECRARVNVPVWHPWSSLDEAVRDRLTCSAGSGPPVPPRRDPLSAGWMCAVHSPRAFGQPITTGYVRLRSASDCKAWLSVGEYRLPPEVKARVEGCRSDDEASAEHCRRQSAAAWADFCRRAEPLSIDVGARGTNFVLRRVSRAEPCQAFEADTPFRMTGQIGDPALFLQPGDGSGVPDVRAGCRTDLVSLETVGGSHDPSLRYGDQVKLRFSGRPECPWLGVRDSRLSCSESGDVFVLEEPSPWTLRDALKFEPQEWLHTQLGLDTRTAALIAQNRPDNPAELVRLGIVSETTLRRLDAVIASLSPPTDCKSAQD